MKTVPAGEFKARCLRIMEEVRTKRVTVLITKKGRPVAKLVPADEDADEVFGRLQGVLEITGDIEAPVVAPEDWKVLR
ncbi:MAG TPA: type II toxin-antitoxin system Phd/YefM family antitoxin [Methylomirabilota bacterium]|jgi:prevent-host-death family protein|nr:type II toxin-antitoxin system Phd/YefM family antitoxin [Methylomirabilota bacterium]